jgi:hypothetical protein
VGEGLDNVRFVILPWMRVAHLASQVPALAARHVAGDMLAR